MSKTAVLAEAKEEVMNVNYAGCRIEDLVIGSLVEMRKQEERDCTLEDFVLEDMDLAANELSIYDKLSETVDLVRQTGHQCGMSEKAIEKFIRQLLEKNEPQRGPPQYPFLLAVYKVLITLGLILLTAYFVIQPFSPLPPEPVLSGAHTWRSLIHHIRLMSLPITKKYMPENKGVPLHGGDADRPFPAFKNYYIFLLPLLGLLNLPTVSAYSISLPLSDFDPWWTNDCEQNESDPIPANCTGCAQKLPLKVMLLEDTPRKFERLHPLVIKTGQPLSSEELQRFSCQYPEVTEGFTEGFFIKWWRCFPERWFPFPYPCTPFKSDDTEERTVEKPMMRDKGDEPKRRRPLNRSHILRELFPVFTYLPFPKEASLKKCFLLQPEPIVGSKLHRMHDLFTIGSGEAMLQLIPPFQCRRHCQSVAMPLEPGDIGYAGATHWKVYIIARGVQPLVICDGTTLSEL
ncbi:Bombesin receptor-activated protein C6orf89-like protein [Camelus dromedarius]|uniref:Bombesin receptor-activated protein C6orf89-like protein n=1 Tax=Camelus dromedarius TaxID=9838 RepID=A0A5N4CRE5_CAMDR|nr:Bombesin receptor-activated protein C6orf89-like protein [Camelus dromedarius]